MELAICEEGLQTARRRAKTLRTLSPQITLKCLAHVACDIINVIDCNNLANLPIICHHIVNLGETCLFQLSELPWVCQTGKCYDLKRG